MSYLQKNKDSFVENKGNVVAKRKQNQVKKICLYLLNMFTVK